MELVGISHAFFLGHSAVVKRLFSQALDTRVTAATMLGKSAELLPNIDPWVRQDISTLLAQMCF